MKTYVIHVEISDDITVEAESPREAIEQAKADPLAGGHIECTILHEEEGGGSQ